MTNDLLLIQCVVREENGKMIAESAKFSSVREIQGGDMVEVGYIR